MEKMDKKQKASKIAQAFLQNYPSPKTELKFENEMQLVIAVVLSAQTTDKKVNQVTKELFKKYLTWEDFAHAEIPQLETDIYGVNFHKTKAKRIKDLASKILTDFQGNVPKTMISLLTLPGIARKTANVIMQELWDTAEGIVVDTHATRVCNRLGLVSTTNAVKIEKELMEMLPQKFWRNFSGAIVLHGRYVCTAKNPKCEKCYLKEFCDFFNNNPAPGVTTNPPRLSPNS